jgi:hypothetical protein
MRAGLRMKRGEFERIRKKQERYKEYEKDKIYSKGENKRKRLHED